ncbi:hypothetical protein SKAU_G00416720 [Synaphobranchus kaupii]|uniref:ribonuclease H n=1 Tax=Synaphobranchus kaupii TaxID=118154 RepID=A0A9Q1IAQ8_SYNKA|nr:hypothetical protein SKAU_G00416670 [Synaphobranchus kaupii]KAJ8332776.1 hypothetical protein SKAU_G00416720 [Synaphobranchus kaupii]
MAPLDFLVRHVYPSCWLGGSICREETSTAAALLRSRGTARVRNSRLGTATTYTEAVELMKNHFAAPQSALLRRVIFRRRHQQTDTGATVSLLNLATYMQFFTHEPLGPPTTTLGGYANAEIDIVGSLQLPVRYGEKTLPVFRFNIARHGTNLLGLDLFNGLGFTLLYTADSEIHTIAIPWQQQWPVLFSGCLNVFAHQPLLDPKVTFVIQPLRCSPLALHDDISSQQLSMLDDDIIEQVNASPWISNLVVKKRSGGLRLCMDLRAVNKAIIPDKYPLQTTEELTAQFHGSTVFSKLDLRQGYLQVPQHPESRNLTAFITHKGVFRYKCMAFSLRPQLLPKNHGLHLRWDPGCGHLS